MSAPEPIASAAAAAPVSQQPSVPPASGNAGTTAAAASFSLAPEYLAGITLSDSDRKGFEGFGSALKRGGVGATVGNAVLSWTFQARQRDEPPEAAEVRHSFTYNAAHFEADDAPYLTSLLNAMQDAGATQADVDTTLGLYAKVQQAQAREEAADYRETERMDSADAQKARAWLATEYGDEARPSFRLLKQYLANLPEAERAALESERNAEGVAALNDPKRLRELIEVARGGGKAAPQQSPAEERAEIERVMREDRGRYNRDERMGARYRDLLRGATPTNDKPAPQDRAALDAEIAKLEGSMRVNRAAWFRDEVSQARLRRLYGLRGN